MLSFVDITCPYCGEAIEIALDASGGEQQYVEDCQVCCRPIVMSVTLDDAGDAQVSARGENDA